MFILSTTYAANLSISDVPFPALLLTLFRRRFLVKPTTLFIPFDLFLLVEESYGTRWLFFLAVEIGCFTACIVFSYFSQTLPAQQAGLQLRFGGTNDTRRHIKRREISVLVLSSSWKWRWSGNGGGINIKHPVFRSGNIMPSDTAPKYISMN
jgi:membrane protease YdiL (CAAX protease family)